MEKLCRFLAFATGRWLAISAFCLVLVTAQAAEHPVEGEGQPAPDGLAGQFLIAEPDMTDPNFEETVILMLEHDAGGALGLVINRPLASVAPSRLLETPGSEDDGT